MAVSVRPYQQGSVRGFLHEPDEPPSGSMVLTHGAGSNCQSLLLRALAESFAHQSLLVLRCDLPFRQARATGPPSRSSGPTDRQGIGDAVAQMRTLAKAPIFLAGHSYGGRQASILATEQPSLKLAALLLLSYPLHPPDKPEVLRTAHFNALLTSSFFAQGTRDPFGSPEELREALQLIPATTRTRLLLLQGCGHDLSPAKSDLARLCAFSFLDFVGARKA